MEEKEPTRFSFKIDGKIYTSDWAGEHIAGKDGQVEEGEPAREFAEEYTDLWQEKLGELGTVIDEETDFEHAGQDEAGIDYRGTGFYSRFRLFTPYMPTELSQVRIYYMKKEHIGNADEVREELDEKEDEEAAA